MNHHLPSSILIYQNHFLPPPIIISLCEYRIRRSKEKRSAINDTGFAFTKLDRQPNVSAQWICGIIHIIRKQKSVFVDQYNIHTIEAKQSIFPLLKTSATFYSTTKLFDAEISKVEKNILV